MRLDEATARRIVRSRFALEEKSFEGGEERLLLAMRNLPSKRQARMRAVARGVEAAFGRLLLRININKRDVRALVLLWQTDGSAQLIVGYFGREDEDPRDGELAHISSHAVARLVERKLDPDAIATIREEINDDVVDAITALARKVQDMGVAVPHGTEIKSPHGRFRVETEIKANGRVRTILVTWLREKPD